VPILATEQNPGRMGGTHERLLPLVKSSPLEKMAFSCAGCTEFSDSLITLQRPQIVLIGIETHICISQTALDLLTKGFEVIVCADAVSARSPDRHSLGLERIRDAGAGIAHTESVAYEWMGAADSPAFREALELVKSHS
jgi:isochorismate hydrolase